MASSLLFSSSGSPAPLLCPSSHSLSSPNHSGKYGEKVRVSPLSPLPKEKCLENGFDERALGVAKVKRNCANMKNLMKKAVKK